MVNFEHVKQKILESDIKSIISKETNLSFNKNKLKSCPFCGSGSGSKGTSGFLIKNNLYKCFSCGVGGDAIKFLMDFKNMDYKNVMEYYDNGIETTFKALPKKETKQTETKSDTEINKAFINYIDTYIDKKEYKEIKSYLDNRRVFIEQNKNIHILTNYKQVNQYLKTSFTKEKRSKSGLFSLKDNLIFFNHRIIFSHTWNDEIKYLHARTHKKEAGFKYMYQSAKKIPFNLPAINAKYSDIYLCEGVFDALSLIQDNKNAISLGSVNAPKETFDFIAKKASENKNKIIVLFDNDSAAKTALLSDRFTNFANQLESLNVSYSFEQTKDSDINESYNISLKEKVSDFYTWCLNTAKNDFWYKVDTPEQLNVIEETINKSHNDVIGIELNADKTKVRIIDLEF